MTIWVDADACPGVIREIICKAANRTKTETVFIANSYIRLPPSPHVRFVQVPKGFDIADNEIAARTAKGDMVITGDIPLAAEVMEKKAEAINTRGEPYSEDTIRQRLNMRDFMDTMRASGVQSGGTPPLGNAEKQAFANALDRYLARKAKQ
ncbi:MAG: YaiI/YqxD family protein [Pseudomonadales bacterium]|nr:YaiI/YqxD family protein [Pseudomonadales bacterium]MBO7005978.1 YaiI/YqxD family protein [Pseudomonadales bacterium]